MKIPAKVKPWIKILALIVGIIADGIMLFACFISQAHDPMSQVAFGALGIMIILLIPITYEEKGYKLWFCLVLVAVFFDTSYLLATTEQRGQQITVATDTELQRLDGEITSNKSLLETQIAEYNKAAKRETLAEIDSQIQTIRNDLKDKEAERKARFEFVQAGFASTYKITAADIFGAIPKALTERFVQLAMYLLISIIIQGMIVFSLSEPKQHKANFVQQLFAAIKKQPLAPPVVSEATILSPVLPVPEALTHVPVVAEQPKKRRRPQRDPVELFVRVNWTLYRAKRSGKTITKNSFDKYFEPRGGFDTGLYKELKQSCIDLGIISPADDIIETNEEQAIARLKEVRNATDS